MTRGKIIYINNDSQVYATCEFNGDMHPHRHGEDILEHFQNGLFQDYKSYDEFVGKLNRKYFGYNEELIGLLRQRRMKNCYHHIHWELYIIRR